jgi:hypothetical protein
LQISDLPPGSIRLKSYNGRSFFNVLLSDPATRKRANVLEVLDGFPDSKFILIGDTGEKDLELYASIASERPKQILAVFIRDVHATGLLEPTGSLPRPTIRRAQTKKMSLPLKSGPGRLFSMRTMSDPDLVTDLGADIDTNGNITSTFTTPPQSFSSIDTSIHHDGAVSLLEPASAPDPKSRPRMSVDSTGSSSSSLSRNIRRATGQTVTPMTEAEKKRLELQTRVNKARLMMESHIILRLFNHPQECTETDRLLEPLKDRNRKHT